MSSIMVLILYLQAEVGLMAINDSYFLESAVYMLLKNYCKGKSYYVDLLELFHEVRPSVQQL